MNTYARWKQIIKWFSIFVFINFVCITAYQKSTDSSVIFSVRTLDTQCLSDDERQKIFDHIFGNNTWGGISRSGPGSTIHGAFNWIQHLRKFLIEYEITSVADVPCGDTFWQFAIREMNTLSKLYFGGDIVTSIIEQNKVWYAEHANKIFAYWDLVKCPIPTFSFYNRTSTVRGQSFDLIIVRDAIMHMNIRNGLKAVQNVINSDAKYFAVSSYPANCSLVNFCNIGNITDGNYYTNNINCYPFNFPISKALVIEQSHTHFPDGTDELHIYPIDSELKAIVQQYDNACN